MHYAGRCAKLIKLLKQNQDAEKYFCSYYLILVIKSFTPIENMNVEKLRFTKIHLAMSVLNEFKNVHSLNPDVANANVFLFYNDFCHLLIIAKDYLMDS